jgi:N-acetylglucosamine kinase-like BadF-type ATPase
MAEFIIGLDGGWSKTAGVICDANGRVLATVGAGGSHVAGKPHAEALKLLNALVDELCRRGRARRNDVIHVGLGLNGVDYGDEASQQHAILCDALKIERPRLTLVNDGVAGLWGVSPEWRVALVQHGSGLTAAYRDRPGTETIFDSLDVAGIYDLRREAVRVAARMLDGRLNRSLLADRVVAHWQTTDNQFAECVYRMEKSRHLFFSLAPVVFQAWAEGDPIADEMVGHAADDYVLTALAMAKRLAPGPLDVAFSGGVIRAGGTRLLDRIVERLAASCPQARLVPVCLPPECGAVVMAAHTLHLEIAGVFRQLHLEGQVGRRHNQPLMPDVPGKSAPILM